VTARAEPAFTPFVADWSLTKVLIPIGHAMSAYFRSRTFGLERVPVDAPVIFVGKHPRTFLYLETLLLGTHVWWDGKRRPMRVLESRATSLHRAPVIGWMRRHVNAVAATAAHALQALRIGESVVIFPGSTRELYGEPDRLRWAGRDGFARLAIEAQVPVVPFAIVGADRQHPFRVAVGKSSVWLPPFPLPVRLDYHFGEPIAPPSPPGSDASGGRDAARDYAAHVERVTQTLIDDGIAARRRR
jgi:1-acyl-sn-glycerol-3-phosphate acyltransferase